MLRFVMAILAQNLVPVAVLALLAGSGPASAGAWTLPVGEGQVIVSGLYAEAFEAFDGGGSPGGVPPFRKAGMSAFLEYGWNDWLTVVGQVEGQSYAVGRPISLGDAGLAVGMAGGRVRLWHDDRAVLSVELAGRFEPRDDGAPKEDLSGSGIDLRVLGGYGFPLGEWQSFIDLEAAYRARVDDLPGEVRVDAALGTRPRDRLLLLVQSFNAVAADASSGAGGAEHKVELSAVYDLTKTLSWQVGGVATVAGRDVLRERGLVTALWLRF